MGRAEGIGSVAARFCSVCKTRFLILTAATLVALCSVFANAQQTVVLVGAGSTVPLPLYKRWSLDYNQHNPRARLEYLALGTSEGINEVSTGKTDFGAGEAPLGSREMAEKGMIQIPIALIGIVPIYNLPGIHGELHFSGEVLAGIFLGEIKSWNAAQITKLNPGIDLPSLPIKVFYRPAGKGSNYVLTEFLSKTNAGFRARVGVSASPHWPVGEAAERSSDIADKVSGEAGAIGYVELQYAAERKIPFGAVQNPAGHFVRATSESLAAACKAVEAPRWENLGASLTNAGGADSYPITSFTWLYARANPAEPDRTLALAEMLNWMIGEGQQSVAQEGYARLPQPLADAAKGKIQSLR